MNEIGIFTPISSRAKEVMMPNPEITKEIIVAKLHLAGLTESHIVLDALTNPKILQDNPNIVIHTLPHHIEENSSPASPGSRRRRIAIFDKPSREHAEFARYVEHQKMADQDLQDLVKGIDKKVKEQPTPHDPKKVTYNPTREKGIAYFKVLVLNQDPDQEEDIKATSLGAAVFTSEKLHTYDKEHLSPELVKFILALFEIPLEEAMPVI